MDIPTTKSGTKSLLSSRAGEEIEFNEFLGNWKTPVGKMLCWDNRLQVGIARTDASIALALFETLERRSGHGKLLHSS